MQTRNLQALISTRIPQLQIRYGLTLGKAWSGGDTQARSFKVFAATLQSIALALKLLPHAPAIEVR